jgi:TrmH family RNA methyltransferase
LVRDRRARTDEREFVIEGTVAVRDALAAGVAISGVLAGPDADSALLERAVERGIPVDRLERDVIERVADTTTPQPVLAVVPFVDQPLSHLRDASFVVVCAGVRDPGNAGTIIRTAEAAGADGVVCVDGSVDMYNPKTVRAAAGALFHVPIVAGGDPVAVLEQLRGWGVTTVGAVAHGGDDPFSVDLSRRVALVVGNEANGLDDAVEAALDERLTIPLQGRAESLNVSMATAVIAFEVARQRASIRRGGAAR